MSTPTCTPELCAVISRREGEDPIGTAVRASHYLLTELPLPWPRNLLEDTPKLPGLGATLRAATERGTEIRPLALVPQGDLKPGLTRVLLYQRPDQPWAELTGREFILPTRQVADLAGAFLHASDLHEFGVFERDLTGIRDYLTCTHGSVDAACGKLGYPLYRDLREHIAPHHPGTLRAWRTSHFGGHRFAPTVLEFPTARAWAHLTPRTLRRIVRREGDIRTLHRHQRGWAGLDYWGQLAERAAFEREGWQWLTYRKHGEALQPASDAPGTTAAPPASVETRLHFQRPDGTRGTYHARIEYADHVTTSPSTGAEAQRANRYHVTHLHLNTSPREA